MHIFWSLKTSVGCRTPQLSSKMFLTCSTTSNWLVTTRVYIERLNFRSLLWYCMRGSFLSLLSLFKVDSPPPFFPESYVYSASKTCLGTPKGHFLAIYTYISHYLPLYKKSNFWEKSRFSWILAIFDKSKFGRLAGRGWPESWFMSRNIFYRHIKSIFI